MPLPVVAGVRWLRVLRLVSLLLAASSGLGIVYQKMRWWIWRRVRPDHLQERDEAVVMATLASVKAASSVATEVATLSRIMLAVHSGGKLCTTNTVRALQEQSFKLIEVERMMRSMLEKMDRRQQASVTNDKHVKALQSSTTNSISQSLSFVEVMAMLERGETPPGIKNINDKPPIPNQPLSLSCLPPKPKPWEKAQRAKINDVPYMFRQ